MVISALALIGGADRSSAETAETLPSPADARFRERYLDWDVAAPPQQSMQRVPAMRPVERMWQTSPFGARRYALGGGHRLHAGIDLAAPVGTAVRAVEDGVIVRAGYAGDYGNLIEIDNYGGMSTRYAHLAKILVSRHAWVRRGDVIGTVGSTGRSTGSHLHYELRFNGRAIDPSLSLSGSVLRPVRAIENTTPTISRFARLKRTDDGVGLP